jgi:hypothetical protein
MPAVTLKAHYDGERIVLDEPFDIPPISDFRSLVIPHIVRYEMDFGSVVIPNKLLEKSQECVGIKPMHKAGMPFRIVSYFYCSHDFDTFANRRGQDMESDSNQCPAPVECAGLLKARFILIQHYAFLLFGFFLICRNRGSKKVKNLVVLERSRR